MVPSGQSQAASPERVETQTIAGLSSRCASQHRLFEDIRDLALSDASVLILGESGVGKGLVARALHQLSPRHHRPLITVSCTGLSAARLRISLEGEEPAKPPAQPRCPYCTPINVPRSVARPRWGALAQARGGTLLLDDVGALDLEAQAELLRALNCEPTLLRLPVQRNRKVRLLATATEDLAKLVRLSRFRAELYHRLAAARLSIPPLRERLTDVQVLAAELLATAAARYQRPVPAIEPEALAVLTAYLWPGNVRELAHVMERALLRNHGGAVDADDLAGLLYAVPAAPRLEIPVGWTLAAVEREVILQTLAIHAGNRQQTADTLAISRRTLYEKLAHYKAQDGTALVPCRRAAKNRAQVTPPGDRPDASAYRAPRGPAARGGLAGASAGSQADRRS